MRQLDLFASFLEPTGDDSKPEEKAVLPEKDLDSGLSAASLSRSFSKNSLRKGTPEPGESGLVVNAEESGSAELNKQTNETRLAAPAMPTLFDLEYELPVPTPPESETSDPGEVVMIPEEDEPAAFLATIEVAEAGLEISDQPFKVEIVEPALEVVARVRKKPATKRQTTLKAPELERTGPIIFDDGKIAVKIKTSSPFPSPLPTVKKEKVKKEPQKRGRKSFKEIDAEIDLVEVPDDEILFQKQYYPISEVAKWFRVNTSLLRFWENEFDILKPRKNRKGDRLFRPEDVKNLQLIYQLLRQRKYTIEGAKEYIKTNKKKADIQLHLTNTLQKFKSFLLDLKANLQS